jgi:LmbE family N-acetylglucosaminyl deacetylase
MLTLGLDCPNDRPLSVLAVGAHPDDIELGAGGTLLTLADSHPGLRVHYLVLTGSADRQLEARAAAEAFLPGAEVTVRLHELRESRLPTVWNNVKDVLQAAAEEGTPDLVIAPNTGDAHQDHRTIAEIVPTVFRDQLTLGYEVPKWDGDLGRPSVYVALSAETARKKVELLHKSFPSQRHRDWWDEEVFLGLARLRGMECRAPYAEAFTCSKSLIALSSTGPGPTTEARNQA